MATEIFLQPELEELVLEPEKKTEWEQKVNQLGLNGQLELTKNSEKNSASPYTCMNAQMLLAFRTICPARISVDRFNRSVIPIDVLSHIALCRQEGYFKKLEIWFDEKAPDPILVGYVTDSYSESIIHLIARWGDEIIPYEQIVEKAIKRYTDGFILAVKNTQHECEIALNNADTFVRQLFAGQKNEWTIKPSFNMVS